ncbi:o-succinylbenzoate--CoA ligase [Sphingobium chlorophenolicum L-1]|uniref:O-succinylbenzoate--CoA ligase n=1 Tax=Sphingobium chlorophenolicum L-1 TaxID=690566 RepID=F6F1Z2_SPHCR|nr:long-chain-fatty-acid--CoA ligase [Sphingobium chlorophenolicum]AEG51558.1 o-succinylbenzoate--CoA ligase [Sphingobium chlorophenolicum L-1]
MSVTEARAPETNRSAAPLFGGMQDWPLTVDKIITHATLAHPHARVVTRAGDRSVRETTYAEIEKVSRTISSALAAYGIGAGDMVATLATNNDTHVALWYGAGGIGAVIHPINPRLSVEQIGWIISHANDRILFAEAGFIPLLQSLGSALPSTLTIVLMESPVVPADLGFSAISFETFLEAGQEPCVWGGFPEDSACALFYTSGTTSNPKGVLYSHRSNVLHALSSAIAYGLQPGDVAMPVVPMFHANCWGLIHNAPLVGASLVLPGPHLDSASLCELFIEHGVTHAAGVPTMWNALYNHLKETGRQLPKLRKLFTAGSAASRSLIERMESEFGIEIVCAWGMTEASPSGTMGGLAPIGSAEPEKRLTDGMRQGKMLFGVEMAIKDDEGVKLPHDGASAGRLMIRGPWIVGEYYRSDAEIRDEEGYFDTGDVAVLHPDSVLQIVDRAKDIIKSGGEWISSLAIEDAATLHPAVEACAVIGVPDDRWDERPLLIVKRLPGAVIEEGEIRDFLSERIQKWWLPDHVVFDDDLPVGATGKFDKKLLRARYADRFGVVNSLTV